MGRGITQNTNSLFFKKINRLGTHAKNMKWIELLYNWKPSAQNIST
jgi:hypothetical protein